MNLVALAAASLTLIASGGMPGSLATESPTAGKTVQAGPLAVSMKAFEKIVYFETGGQRYYEKALRRPTYPGGASGVTVGIGYDCGYNSSAVIRRDWGVLPSAAREALARTSGKTGARAKVLLSSVKWIEVPWTSAQGVFSTTSMPKFGGMTSAAFPGLKDHPGDTQGALLSIGFNRGLAMGGDSRREMRVIRDIVRYGDSPANRKAIAEQIRSMKRLWRNKGLNGLLARRDAEAALVEGSR